MTITFEQLYQFALTLERPEREDQRRIEWSGPESRVALARDISGGYEIFLRCDPVSPTLPLVRRNMSFGDWTDSSDNLFSANRLILPSDLHFVPVAAFIAEELLRNGAEQNPEEAFLVSEPIIDMALRRNTLDDQEVIGLIGELSFLKGLLDKSEEATSVARCLDSWKGNERSSRDFVFRNNFGIEIKSTQGDRSTHHVNSISQVDPARTASGEPSEELILLSYGFESCEEGNGFSLPELVESILLCLGPKSSVGERNEIQELFLNHVKDYGLSKSKGYIHDEMQNWPVYQGRWAESFCRAYQMNFEEVSVLRRDDVVGARFTKTDTVEFAVELPDRINSYNPVSGIFLLVGFVVDDPGGTFQQYVEDQLQG